MLAVRLPQELENRLNSYTQKTDKTKTEIVKDALKLFFKTQEKEESLTPYELGKDFFGRYESQSDDLSVHYKEKLKGKLREKYDTHR